MSSFPSLSTRQIVKALRRGGFVHAPVRGKGSHRALTRTDSDGTVLLVIIPERKSLPTGTLRSIIRQAGLTREQFLALL